MGAARADVVIHVNPQQPHQGLYGGLWVKGISRHGFKAEVALQPERDGDTHIVIGPHFALAYWRNHQRCLHVDRAFWGDPQSVSVGWARDGRRVWPDPRFPRLAPEAAPWRHGPHAIVLSDYGDDGEAEAAMVRPHVESVEIRRHPADGGQGPLVEALEGKQIAIGRMTTALIDAAILGLAVVCRDGKNPVMPVASTTIRCLQYPDRGAWLQKLAWGNWTASEIESGECWEWMRHCC